MTIWIINQNRRKQKLNPFELCRLSYDEWSRKNSLTEKIKDCFHFIVNNNKKEKIKDEGYLLYEI